MRTAIVASSAVKTAAEVLVLQTLADHMQADGTRIYPAVKTLGRATRLSVETVRRTLTRLCDKGLIVPTTPRTGGRQTTRYAFGAELLACLRVDDHDLTPVMVTALLGHGDRPPPSPCLPNRDPEERNRKKKSTATTPSATTARSSSGPWWGKFKDVPWAEVEQGWITWTLACDHLAPDKRTAVQAEDARRDRAIAARSEQEARRTRDYLVELRTVRVHTQAVADWAATQPELHRQPGEDFCLWRCRVAVGYQQAHTSAA